MKTQTLYRLGALATLATAIGFTFGEFIYFFGAAHTILFSWVFFIVGILEMFMIITLFTAQVKRGNLFILIGFVLLVIQIIVANMNQVGDLGADAGVLSRAQLEKVPQISIFAVLLAVERWTWPSGMVLFGFGTYRAGVFPRWAGILLILLGVVTLLTGFSIFIEYLFAALAFAAFGWLGWSLWKNAGAFGE